MKFKTLHPVKCKKCEKKSTISVTFNFGDSDEVFSDIVVGAETTIPDGVYHTEAKCPVCKEPVTLCAYIKSGIFRGIYVE